ncbi:hypothetical protein SOCE26_078480 [Sorangium cellulosum]|uniref:TonB C-terminal domain-containing protein n=1 Tax=Sorangium cellulosum TaxID=56 RepID=A0A2L0F459_SORCE|nr:AgmX/PglI C-terminal domain-containing protein [Sorangium cellulosum]AUX46342.1 hypothetical protein SOCE26_078480 [Sorangium cellulosum]
MSSRRTGLLLLIALLGGCASTPPPPPEPAQSGSPAPAGAASPAPAGAASPAPAGTPAGAAAGPTPAAGEAPPPGAQVPQTKPAAAAATDATGKPAAGGSHGSVRPSTGTATGTLGGNISEADVRDVVEKHGELFDECYKIGIKGSPKFMGKVTVKATIGPSGKVNKADVVRSTAKNAQVDACVASAFEKMLFPIPKGGVTTVITFPIEFSGLEVVQP